MTEQPRLPANWEPRKPNLDSKPISGHRKKSPYPAILLTLLGTFLLTAGSFFGCAASLASLRGGRQNGWVTFFLVSFAIGVVGFVVTALGLIVRLIIGAFRGGSED